MKDESAAPNRLLSNDVSGSGREICCCQFSLGLFFFGQLSEFAFRYSTPLDISWVLSVVPDSYNSNK